MAKKSWLEIGTTIVNLDNVTHLSIHRGNVVFHLVNGDKINIGPKSHDEGNAEKFLQNLLDAIDTEVIDSISGAEKFKNTTDALINAFKI